MVKAQVSSVLIVKILKNVYVAIYDIFVERENISLKFKQNQIAILGSCHDVEGCIKRKKLTKLLFSEGFGDPL